MVWQGLKVLAVIPARGGSKSIPRKNLCKVEGISLVGRAAMICNDLPWIDRAILSTDDQEIATEAKKYGVEVPFMRPEEISGDQSTSVDMWVHAWLASEKYYGFRFDLSILLEPTSPLRLAEDVERVIKVLVEGKFSAAATISRNPAHFTPHKCLEIRDDGTISFYLEDGQRYSLRQKVPAYYHRNGICYAATRDTLINKKQILENNCAAVLIDRPVVNIDDYYDLEYAEYLLKKHTDSMKS